jgi:hypothetical protein
VQTEQWVKVDEPEEEREEEADGKILSEILKPTFRS